jgi:GNAT superfamily N-acetyltransferase
MEHRLATLSDLDRVMEIIADAQRFLKENGVDQWQNGYPTREIFEADIKKGCCHAFTLEGKLAGVISVFFENEASYKRVYDGSWLTGDAPYTVFHRAAVSGDYRGMGTASEMLSYAENLALERGFKSMRGDTHRDNKAMRALLEKRGFVHCGTILIDSGEEATSERVCYEKLL